MPFVEDHRMIVHDGVEYARFDEKGYANLGRELNLDGQFVRRAIGIRLADSGGSISDEQLIQETKYLLDEWANEQR